MTSGETSIVAQNTSVSASACARSPLDESVLANLIASIGPEAIEAQNEIFDLFFASTPRLMAKVNDGARSGDWEQVRAALHALKGSCELFGASYLTQLCKQLGRLLANGETGQAPALAAEIDMESQRVVEALRAKRPARAVPGENNREGDNPTQE
jgi:HPt (histidine-containing phosphotransfer) domain-containing protein